MLPDATAAPPAPQPAEARTGGHRLVLAGGGHAHVEVLRRLAGASRPALDVTLVSPDAAHPYTGMLTGFVAGEYALRELLFPLDALARRAGATFVQGRVAGIQPDERAVLLEDGGRLEYDLLSLDVGSGVEGAELLPADDQRVFAARPLERVIALAAALDELAPGARLVVVGGGPSGVELALTSHARLVRRGARPRVLVLEARHRLLPEAPRATGALAERVLRARGVAVRTGTQVSQALDGVVRDGSAAEHPYDLLLWAPGPAPIRLAGSSRLAVDETGWLRVDDALRVIGVPGVFAAGDCAALEGSPGLAKAGVYAVRQGPALWSSLLAALGGAPLPAFRPQRRYLWILNTGAGTGLLEWGALHAHSRWARILKDRIDRRFMRRYGVAGA